MRFGWFAAAAAVLVLAGHARAQTVVQTFDSSFQNHGSTGAVYVGGLNLAPKQKIASITIQYRDSAFFSQELFALPDSAVTSLTYSGGTGFYITGLPLAVGASLSDSGTVDCTDVCAADISDYGTIVVPPADFDFFDAPNLIQLSASGGINGTINSTASTLLLQTLYRGIESSGTITYQLVTDVPEPATWMSMMLGFGLIGVAVRRRQAIAARIPKTSGLLLSV